VTQVEEIDSDDSDLEGDPVNGKGKANGKAKAEEEEGEDIDNEKDEKPRVKQEGDVDDEDLLASYDGTEDVSVIQLRR